jgi:hypothetical protein
MPFIPLSIMTGLEGWWIWLAVATVRTDGSIASARWRMTTNSEMVRLTGLPPDRMIGCRM